MLFGPVPESTNVKYLVPEVIFSAVTVTVVAFPVTSPMNPLVAVT